MFGRQLKLACLCLLASTQLLAAEHRLWSAIDSNDGELLAATLQLPGQVGWQQAIRIDRAALALWQTGDTLTLQTPSFAALDYQLVLQSLLLNGDTAWQGQLLDAATSGGLSLTINEQSLLGNFFKRSDKYGILTRLTADGSAYVGWLYSLSGNRQRVAPDAGGFIKSSFKEAEQVALSGNDVTITQTFSKQFAVIGERIDVTIQITNNTSATLTNEAVNILFVADNTQFLESNSGCTLGSTGSQGSIQCTIASVAAGASTSLHYAVRLTEDSYSQVASGVFVGELFGNYVRNDGFVFVSKDTLSDSDGDGYSDFNEAILGTDPAEAGSALPVDTFADVDLLVLYTQEFLNEIGSLAPETRLNQLIATTNSYYLNSGAGIRFRPVYYGKTNYTVSNLNTALTALSSGQGEFSTLAALRAQRGADIVVLIDGLIGSDNACGLASTPGGQFNGELFHPSLSDSELYTTLYLDGFPAGGGSGCEDDTLAHELGHNFGLVHSRRQSGSKGTYSWSHGHGVDGQFTTIMAYSSRFPGATGIPLFSNPDNTQCNGLPCGVDRNDSKQGADAVHSLNETRFQIAAKRQSRVLDIATLDGSSSSLLMLGAATRNGNASSVVSAFSPQDSIDVRATLQIPTEHQGQTGQTYTVIAVAGAGLFYRDANGAYIAWDGAFSTLGGAINPRPLAAEEELIAFSEFVPGSFGVNAASVTVFFAYGIGSDVFVYSANGIPFSIQ